MPKCEASVAALGGRRNSWIKSASSWSSSSVRRVPAVASSKPAVAALRQDHHQRPPLARMQNCRAESDACAGTTIHAFVADVSPSAPVCSGVRPGSWELSSQCKLSASLGEPTDSKAIVKSHSSFPARPCSQHLRCSSQLRPNRMSGIAATLRSTPSHPAISYAP